MPRNRTIFQVWGLWFLLWYSKNDLRISLLKKTITYIYSTTSPKIGIPIGWEPFGQLVLRYTRLPARLCIKVARGGWGFRELSRLRSGYQVSGSEVCRALQIGTWCCWIDIPRSQDGESWWCHQLAAGKCWWIFRWGGGCCWTILSHDFGEKSKK